jgi:hypothetical protein
VQRFCINDKKKGRWEEVATAIDVTWRPSTINSAIAIAVWYLRADLYTGARVEVHAARICAIAAYVWARICILFFAEDRVKLQSDDDIQLLRFPRWERERREIFHRRNSRS